MFFRFVTAALLAVCTAFPQDAAAPGRRIALFNGKNLDGWYTWLRESRYADPKQVFSVKNGEIHISGEEWGGLTTRRPYREYHLIVEWRWGTKTWGKRENKARDSGILVHGVGEDGAAGGTWLESIESQIIEGGTGDIILVAGKNRPSLTATVREQGREVYWDRNGMPVSRNSGRIDWWGRSPEWKDEFGFRGPNDVENRPGEWNRQEVYADGDKLAYILNGKLVNQAYNLSHRSGKIQIQSEGAEIFIRKVEVEPIRGAAPRAGLPDYDGHRAASPITADTKLDDPAWQDAPPAGDFHFRPGKEGTGEKTVTRIPWDDETRTSAISASTGTSRLM